MWQSFASASARTGSTVLFQIGASDCEEIGRGLLAQPVNALSSFAYVIVGVGIAAVAQQAGVRRALSFTYGACLIAVGLGSVAFHGPQPTGSREMHDLPILVTALFILVHGASVLVPRLRHPLPVFAVAGIVATLLVLVDVGLAPALTGVTLIGVAVVESLIYRRHLRPVDRRWQRRAYVAIVGVAAAAGASWLLGRSDGPTCDPDSWFQFHGLWHVVSAMIFALWWILALWSGSKPVSMSAKARRVAG